MKERRCIARFFSKVMFTVALRRCPLFPMCTAHLSCSLVHGYAKAKILLTKLGQLHSELRTARFLVVRTSQFEVNKNVSPPDWFQLTVWFACRFNHHIPLEKGTFGRIRKHRKWLPTSGRLGWSDRGRKCS